MFLQEEMTGGADSEEYYRIAQFYMETSQNMAKYQGLTLADRDVEMDFLGYMCWIWQKTLRLKMY